MREKEEKNNMKYNRELLRRFMSEDTPVVTRNQEQYRHFIELLEKETSLTWKSGKALTETPFWLNESSEVVLRSNRGTGLTYDISTAKGIDFFEYVNLMTPFKDEKKKPKFKVGDRVKVKSWEEMWKEYKGNDNMVIFPPNKISFIKDMKKFCNTTQVIKQIDFNQRIATRPAYFTYLLENGEDWSFCDEMLKLSKPALTPLKETKSILDRVERNYLAAVIAPKKIYKNVVSITRKKYSWEGTYYLLIELSNGYRDFVLPDFSESDHMYEGMEENQPYSLERLGLKKEEK